VVPVEPGQPVVVEASVGNTAEARWLARPEGSAGGVFLAARWGGQRLLGGIESDTPYLHDARVPVFEVAPRLERPVAVSFKMTALDRADFGEVVHVTLQPDPNPANPGSEAPVKEREK
jgi:hypothetical protein